VLMTVQIRSQEDIDALAPQELGDTELLHDSPGSSLVDDEQQLAPEQLAERGLRVGRNEPCPCGSGKKYKQCHGRLA